MDKLKTTSLSDIRASLGSFSNFSENNSDDLDDPISVYFQQRCGRLSRAFQKIRESDGSSSIGLIDIDNISLFGEDETENVRLRFSENLPDQVPENPQDLQKSKKVSDNSEVGMSEIQTELDKQRALAQLALRRLSSKTSNSQCDGTVSSSDRKESTVLSDISSKLMNMKLSLEKGSEKDWFKLNFSPNTPRYFNDELSSFGGDDESLPVVDKLKKELNKNRESQYAKKVSSMLKELSEIPLCSDVTFESQTEEEQINRFEEDEKKFNQENAGVLHNSQISQFSGIDEEELAQWLPDQFKDKPETNSKNLSIGQFFNIRSNRISSLIGSVTSDKSTITSESKPETLTTPETAKAELSKSECSFPLEVPAQPKELKMRRCVSTLDLKNPPETTSSMRYSSDSCSSNSTTMIQDILAEMESGLSGTQIYEKLMKSYGKKKEVKTLAEKQKSKPCLGNNETPKSSKTNKKKDKETNKQLLDPNKGLKVQNSNSFIDKETKENVSVRDVKFNDTIPSFANEKIKKRRGSKGFFASTPKNQASKPQNDNFKDDCGKVLMDNEDWEPPKIASIQTIDLSRADGSDEIEKTIVVNSSSSSSEAGKKNNTIVIHDTLSIEDTITAGDLTVLSQRIEEMKQDSVCIVRSAEAEEPVLLTVIQKLADLPKGTLDCSALTPLLRDQFPELLTNFPTPRNSSVNVSSSSKNVQDALVALPGFWVKMPGVWGLKQKIYSCADLEKVVLVPVENITGKWILISLESVELVHPQGKKLKGVKKDNEFYVMDFVKVLLKDTILPPNDSQSLKIFFSSKLATKLELMLTFEIKELISEETQKRTLRLLVTNVHPENYINIFPNDSINFGVIADQCYDVRNLQVSFEGICELPLTVYIEEDESLAGHFCLSTANQPEKKLSDNILHHSFHEGEKQVLDLRISFNPNVLLKDDDKTKDFKAKLVLMLDSKTDTDGILRKIPIKGSVGVAKFLNISSCNPLVFRASEKGQLVTRSYSFKNVGSIPIAFSVSIVDADGEPLNGDDAFLFPETFYLSRNEESDMNITFNARASQHFVKRYLKYQVKPNGRITYEVELIGIITALNSRPLSRTSGVSVSTKSLTSGEAGSARLLTTLPSLSWPAVPLEKESRQAFQIKSLATVDVPVRITFDRNVDAFKLINENGEKVHKLRKVLKPDCPCILTVVFRPDVVGTHNNCLQIEGSLLECKKRVPLNGIGGVPNLTIKNVKTDLNNCKILRLQHSRVTNMFESQIQFKNEGRITAFVLFKVGVKEFSLNHDIVINPTSVVIPPDASVTISFSQKLRNNDFQQLLSDREICKIATILVLSGDEPSRLRIKKLVECEKVQHTDRVNLFMENFKEEKEMDLENFNDSHGLELEFLKSLKVIEMAAVVEKNAEVGETTILEESSDDFVSFISYKTMLPSRKSRQPSESGSSIPSKSVYSNPVEINATLFSVESLQSVPARGRVTKWLETLDGV